MLWHASARRCTSMPRAAAEDGQNPEVPPASGGPSQADLAAAPVAAELVVANLGAGLHAEPLWQRPVLVQLLRQVLLELEGLDRTHAGGELVPQELVGIVLGYP